MKKLAIVVATLFILSGCSLFGGGESGGGESMGASANADVAAAIKAAEEAIKKAKSVDGQWRDEDKFLKQAKAAAAKGDDKAALKLANKAKFQGEMGYQQAKEQEKAGPWLF